MRVSRKRRSIVSFRPSSRKYYPDFLKDQVGHELQPLADIHLTSKLDFEMRQNGDAGSVNILWVIGFFIIVLAAVNFMNLATARSAYRAREVGVRKAAGATRGQLIGQFLLESVLMSLLAALIALVLIHLLMPAFNALTGETIPVPSGLVGCSRDRRAGRFAQWHVPGVLPCPPSSQLWS
jgi:putative ABC transport system permease protein